MAIIPKFYVNAVVAIGVGDVSNVTWCGTGFLAYRIVNKDGDMHPLLITNKHVFEDEKQVVIRLRKKDSEDFHTINVSLFENGRQLYYVHPINDIDIAVLPLNGKFFTDNQLAFDAFSIDDSNFAMSSEELRNEGVDEGTLIHMLGYPMGLVNINSTLPICRLGCVARMSKAQIDESYNILVDIQNFPGNSGSPIVTRPEIVSIQGTKALKRSVLFGIIHSYIPYQETLMNTQTKRIVEVRSENSGIAKVHPVEYIREVVDLIVPKYTKKEETTEEKEM